MKKGFWLVAIAPFLFIGCAGEPTTVTTTEVTRTVTTTEPVVAGREVVVTRTPPVVRVETQTVAPGSGYVWTRGYWRWTGADYVWVPGSWVARPRPAAVWVQGQWLRRGAGWVYISGHWQ